MNKSSLSYTALGVLAGLVIAFFALQFGFPGLLISLILAAVGGLIGAHYDGRIDLGVLLGRLGPGSRG